MWRRSEEEELEVPGRQSNATLPGAANLATSMSTPIGSREESDPDSYSVPIQVETHPGRR